jgi:hypothetical protein
VYYASSSFLSDDALDFLAGYTDEIPRASENQPDLYQPGASAAQIFLSQFYDNEFLYPGEAEEIYGDIVIRITFAASGSLCFMMHLRTSRLAGLRISPASWSR